MTKKEEEIIITLRSNGQHTALEIQGDPTPAFAINICVELLPKLISQMAARLALWDQKTKKNIVYKAITYMTK